MSPETSPLHSPLHSATSLPQIINFVYSIPQLLKIVPCPRHRLPKFEKETCACILHPRLRALPLAAAVAAILNRLALNPAISSLAVRPSDGQCASSRNARSGLLHATPNMNLVNLALRVLGPQTERMLCIKLLVFQALCCGMCFGARWLMAGWWKY